MTNISLYPLKFEPIYQYRLWGGRRLAQWLAKPLPVDEPIGEAWLLSDRDDHASLVSNGPLKGYTIKQLMTQWPEKLMGKVKTNNTRFPLLLKFLDCKEVLSVQVHPSDEQTQYIPKGDTGKTEAWVVLETDNSSHIYAGLKPGTTKQSLRQAIQNNTVADMLHSFIPHPGDGVFIQSGTVHTLGGAVVFEVQENSDVTFRLYDWDRVDTQTGKPRELQVDKAIACIDFNQVNIGAVKPVIDKADASKEKLFDNSHFILWRIHSATSCNVGIQDAPRIVVCVEGHGNLVYNGASYTLDKGDVMLLPAALGRCIFQPSVHSTLLEIGIPHV